ncbi:ABC transporter permease, partial [Leucobacter chromiireducens subsp. solipictus]|nr:ABC transporter permease [Leucobacter chromiireducens subsp. solipictus]
MIGALELGLIYGVMALGVYLTFRVLNFPDL